MRISSPSFEKIANPPENDTDGCRSFAAGERSVSDRLLAGCGKTFRACLNITGLHDCGNRSLPYRMLKKARLLTRPTLARQDSPCPKQGPFNSLYLFLGEWPRMLFTARIERAHSYCARSASKKGTWPLPLPAGGLFQHPATHRNTGHTRMDAAATAWDRLPCGVCSRSRHRSGPC